MNKLKEKFRLNGLQYTLIKRKEVVALYGINGTYTGKVHHYEVGVIYTRKDKYGESEAIAKSDDFGRDLSRCFKSKDEAEAYFDELTKVLMMKRILSQGVARSIAGVEDNAEVIPEYQLV